MYACCISCHGSLDTCSASSSPSKKKSQCPQAASNRAMTSSPGRSAKQPQASTAVNSQQQIRKRNAAAKKKLQEDLAEKTALVETLQQQVAAMAKVDGSKVIKFVLDCCQAMLQHSLSACQQPPQSLNPVPNFASSCVAGVA